MTDKEQTWLLLVQTHIVTCAGSGAEKSVECMAAACNIDLRCLMNNALDMAQQVNEFCHWQLGNGHPPEWLKWRKLNGE